MKIQSFQNIVNDTQSLIDSANGLVCALSDNIKEPRIFYDFDEISLQWNNENDDPFPYIEIKVLDCLQYEFEYYLENNFIR